MKRGNLFLLCNLFVLLSHAQSEPDWKFYLAFEEGAGQKDTIWFIHDSTATKYYNYITQEYTIDSSLGEIPIHLDTSIFNVFLPQAQDTFKTMALPFTNTINFEIHSINYTYPNPFNEAVKIKFSQNFSGIITLISIDGKLLYKKVIHKQNNCTINTGSFDKGAYILVVENEKSKYIQKLIKD